MLDTLNVLGIGFMNEREKLVVSIMLDTLNVLGIGFMNEREKTRIFYIF
jgi:hypothetical protein